MQSAVFQDASSMLVSPDAQARRMASLRRAFMNQLKRKPTTEELTALNRAIRLTLRAELAAIDPNASLDDIVRIDGAASRARKAWTRLAETRRLSAPSMREVWAQTI